MKYGIAIILTVGLLSTCFSVKTTPKKESRTIDQNIRPTPGRPNLTAPEVLTEVLDFLRHVQSPEGLQIETAGKVMSLRLLERTDGYSDFYIGNKSGDSDWIWSTNFTKDQSGEMHLNFGDMGGYSPTTPIYQMDLDRFHPLLMKTRFIYTGKGHWGRPFSDYEKRYPNGYGANLQIFYRGESTEKVLYDCANEIAFGAFKPRW